MKYEQQLIDKFDSENNHNQKQNDDAKYSKNRTAYIILVYGLPIAFGVSLLVITVLLSCCIKKIVIEDRSQWICREKPRKFFLSLLICKKKNTEIVEQNQSDIENQGQNKQKKILKRYVQKRAKSHSQTTTSIKVNESIQRRHPSSNKSTTDTTDANNTQCNLVDSQSQNIPQLKDDRELDTSLTIAQIDHVQSNNNISEIEIKIEDEHTPKIQFNQNKVSFSKNQENKVQLQSLSGNFHIHQNNRQLTQKPEIIKKSIDLHIDSQIDDME
eukprot:403343921